MIAEKVPLLIQINWALISAGLWVHFFWAKRRGRVLELWQPVERVPVSWDPLIAVAAVVSCLLFVPSLVLQLLQVPAGDMQKPWTLYQVQAQCLAGMMVPACVIVLLAVSQTVRLKDLGLDPFRPRRDIWLGVWGTLQCWLPVFLLNLLILPWRESNPHKLLEFLQANPNVTAQIWAAVLAIICAPLEEELLFRVIFQSTLEKTLPAWAAIGLTAAVFVLPHNRADWLPLIPLALLLGVVYHRRRSLVVVVTTHCLFNAINFWIALYELQGK